MVIECNPAGKLVTFCVVCAKYDQSTLIVPVPPEMFVVAEPLLPPKQLTAVVAVTAMVGPAISLMFAIAFVVQPFTSVTVTVYAPATTLLIQELVKSGLLVH